MKAGHICMWRYREHARSYPGYHLSADVAGCDQLLALLADLARTRTSRIANIVLDPVTAAVLAVPNNGDAAISVYRHLEIVVDPRFAPERMHFTVMNDRVRMELSSVQVESLAAGVTDIRQGRGDYAIGEDDDQLWFWWRDA